MLRSTYCFIIVLCVSRKSHFTGCGFCLLSVFHFFVPSSHLVLSLYLPLMPRQRTNPRHASNQRTFCHSLLASLPYRLPLPSLPQPPSHVSLSFLYFLSAILPSFLPPCAQLTSFISFPPGLFLTLCCPLRTFDVYFPLFEWKRVLFPARCKSITFYLFLFLFFLCEHYLFLQFLFLSLALVFIFSIARRHSQIYPYCFSFCS